MTTYFLKSAWLTTMTALLVTGGFTVAKEFERPPVKYVVPFEIVEKDGGYHAGDDLIVRVHFCFAPEVERVFYNSITQSFIPADGSDPLFTDSIIDLIVDKEAILGTGVFYTDMDGYECIKAFGTPKKIPSYAPTGCYHMHFSASVDGRSKKHIIEYDSESFCIS